MRLEVFPLAQAFMPGTNAIDDMLSPLQGASEDWTFVAPKNAVDPHPSLRATQLPLCLKGLVALGQRSNAWISPSPLGGGPPEGGPVRVNPRELLLRMAKGPLKGAGIWNDNLQPRRERLGYKKSGATLSRSAL